uniref:Uncharacterized protein n=1 Tax=Oryza meridionalis TaxID=40149 RepID=A0A0E0DMV1_9ORYZ
MCLDAGWDWAIRASKHVLRLVTVVQLRHSHTGAPSSFAVWNAPAAMRAPHSGTARERRSATTARVPVFRSRAVAGDRRCPPRMYGVDVDVRREPEVDPTDDDGGRHGPDEHGHGGWHGLLYAVRKRAAEGSQQLPGLSQQPPALLRRRLRREALGAAEDDEERREAGVGGDDEGEVPWIVARPAGRLDEGAGEEGERGKVQARPAPPLQVDGYGVGFAGVRRVGGGGGTAHLLLGIVH